MLNRLKKFFRKQEIQTPENRERNLKRPKGFTIELEDLKKKYADFLLTAKVNTGLVVKRKNYFLNKTGFGLYRLEGEEKSGLGYSIIISTMNHLQLNPEKKVTGLIQISEVDLNRAISSEHSSLKSFFSKMKNLKLNDKALELIEEKVKYSWKEVLLWDKYWKEMIFLKLKPNSIALLLVGESESFKNLFLASTSKKQKKIIADELFYLNQGVNSEEMNPNTKNLNLYNFDSAMIDFLKTIQEIKKLAGFDSVN